MGFNETSYGTKPNLSDIHLDCDLNLKAVGKKVIGDVDFTGISENFDFRGRSVTGINKLTCHDYFGAFIPTESDTVRLSKIFDPVLTGPAGTNWYILDSFAYTIPSVYAAGKVRVRVTANCPVADGLYYASLYIHKISATGVESNICIKTFSSPFSGVFSADIPINAGDKLQLMSNNCINRSFTVSQWDICADETELVLNTGFDWGDWQVV